MALIYCDECGKKISDKANVCPHCGNPIREIQMAEIERQTQEYYKEQNKRQLLINIVCFLGAMFAGYKIMSGELEPWKLIVVVVCVLLFLLMSVSWIQWIAAISIASQQYRHIPKWMVIVTVIFGFAIGSIIGMRT